MNLLKNIQILGRTHCCGTLQVLHQAPALVRLIGAAVAGKTCCKIFGHQLLPLEPLGQRSQQQPALKNGQELPGDPEMATCWQLQGISSHLLAGCPAHPENTYQRLRSLLKLLRLARPAAPCPSVRSGVDSIDENESRNKSSTSKTLP